MNEQSDNFARDSAAFQKIWVDTMTRMMKAAFTVTPDSVPPEVLRQIRSGIFQALTESWNEFLRSPQFQEGMKLWLDRAIAVRKMTNELLVKARKEMQAPTRDDVDAVALAVRHLETKILSRVDELARQVDALKPQSGSAATRKSAGAPAARSGAPKNRPARKNHRAGKKKT
jgi:hypothetical protein